MTVLVRRFTVLARRFTVLARENYSTSTEIDRELQRFTENNDEMSFFSK